MTGLYVVMGVSGCGKSTVAEALAEKSAGIFLDADDFHPPENKRKMAAGVPLTDDDRWGWLEALNAKLASLANGEKPVFLACSALREVYRERLRAGLPGLRFLYLKGTRECIASRLAARKGHFMPSALLDSQFATLEEPTDALVVDIDQSTEAVIQDAASQIARTPGG